MCATQVGDAVQLVTSQQAVHVQCHQAVVQTNQRAGDAADLAVSGREAPSNISGEYENHWSDANKVPCAVQALVEHQNRGVVGEQKD